MKSGKRIEGTNKDKTVGMKYEDSMWGAITAVAAIGLVGAAAYKTGYAKKAMKSFIKKASNVSNNSSISYTRSFRKWLLKDSEDSSSLLRNTLKGTLVKKEEYSKLFKAGTRKELFKDVKERFSNAISKENLYRTVDDVKDLEKTIGKSKQHLNSLADSNIVKEFNEIDKVAKSMKKAGYSKKQIKDVKNSMMKDFIKDNTLTEEARKLDMKRKGYTSLTLGDLFEVKTDLNNNGKSILVRKSSKFNDKDLSILENKINKSFINGKRGKPMPITKHKDILNLKVDSALLSDGENVADLRMFRSLFEDVTNSLAKDFKIPVIGINPFSIMGVHEIGRKGPSFAMLNKGTVQSAITGSAKHTNSDMFFSKGSVYKFTEDGLSKVKSNMSVEKIHAKSTVSSRVLDATRKMNGTSRIDYNEYTDADGAVSNMYGKLGKWLDLGFDDIDVQTLDDLGTGEMLNPNHWISKLTNKFKKTGFLRPNKGVKEIDGKRVEKTFNEMFSDTSMISDKEDIFIAVNEGFSIMDMIKQIGGVDKEEMAKESFSAVKKYTSQFVAGRKNLENVTRKTTTAHFMVDRVSSTLGVGGFGLSVDSLSSTQDIIKNLLLKRALPVYAAYNAAQFAIMLTEGEEDELGNKDNILKDAARAVAKTDLVMHKGFEMFGISAFVSGMMEALPGIDHITELPGINALGLDQDYEERLKHHTEGYTKVRKNRYWDGGNQAFTGGKTDYFAPSLYRRIMADAEFSDTKWGSRAEYFMNAPFPNPLNPLAPIKHFITDPYHYDNKHSEDRPYAVTKPLFQNIPFIGSVLSPTLGEILKPTKYTNPHIFNGGGLVEPPVPSMGNTSLTFDTSSIDEGGGTGEQVTMSYAPMASASGGKTNLIGGFSSSSDDIMSAKTVSSMSTSRTGISYTDGPGADIDMMDDMSTQNQIGYNANQLSEDAANFFGLYGFMATTAMGEPLDDKKYVENASYAYSGSRVFWNQSAGGLGGDTNEIARRFLRKRMHEDSLINPISNNMPDWIPGSDYFTDFKHGDAYCVSLLSIIEKNNLEFVEARCIMKEDIITTHTGDKQEVRELRVRDINNGEKVYSLKVSSLAAINMEFSEEHPILVLENPFARKSNKKVQVKMFKVANDVLKIIVREKGNVSKQDIAKEIGFNQSYVSRAISLLIENKSLEKSENPRIIKIGNPKLYDIRLMEMGMKWEPVKNIKEGDYVAYPIPKFKESDWIIDIGKITKLKYSDKYIYKSKVADEYIRAIEFLDENPHLINYKFKWGERKKITSSINVKDSHWEAALYSLRRGDVIRTPRYVTVTKDLAYAFGLYVAEGSVHNGCVDYSLHVKETDYFARAVSGAHTLDNNINIEKCELRQRSGLGAYGNISSVIFNEVCQYFFKKHSHFKRLPNELADCNKEIVCAFLEGAFDGDGSQFYDKRRNGCYGSKDKLIVSYNTCNKILALQLRKLSLKIGCVFGIIAEKPSKKLPVINGKEIKRRTSYTLKATGHFAKRFSNQVWGDEFDISNRTASHTFIQNDYLYMRVRSNDEAYNVDKVIGYEVDFYDSFCVAGVATHNTKIANGELRLPGQAYERLHNIKKHDLYEIDASSMSSVDSIISATLNKESSSLSLNQDIKQDVMSMYRDNGRMVEGAGTITDYDRHIKAEYDAVVRLGDDEGMLFIGNKESSKNTMIKAQVAMYATGQSMAFIQDVDENGERSQLKRVDYDQRVVNNAMENMVKARDKIEHMKDIGQLSNGDMYSPLDRFRILADTAPYSSEFTKMKSVLSSMDLSDEEREEVADITERVQDVRKPLRLYDYKFLGRETTTDIKVIDSIGGNGTFTVVGDDKEYKLAGIDIKKQEEEIHQQDLDDIMNSFLHVGSTVKLEFDANPALRFKGGYNRVIVHKNGKSLQEELLRRGLADKNTSDDPIDSLVKTNIMQRTIGKAWEAFAHADTPVHSKFLRVRSAKEDYERSRVYGKSFSSWTRPISDYLIPLMFDRNVGRGTISGVLMGGIVGGMFGKNAFGTFVGATLGAGTVLAGKVFTGVKEELKQETWRPDRVVKEQQLYDYMDKLKYVKYRKLYHEYAEKAKGELVNVEGIIGGTRKRNSQNKRKERWLKGWKIKQQKLHQTFKIPNSLLRLMPRADLNISGLFTNEFAYNFLNMKKKLLKTGKEVNRYLALNQSKMDTSKADKAPKGLANALKSTWSLDILEQESDARQKKYINEKMSRTRTKSIIPLRGNFRHDRKAPPSEKLDKLLKAKVILSSSYSKGLSDNDLKKAIKESGVVPVWRGALKSRNIDKDKTMQRLDYEISKQSKKAGFSENAAKALEYYKMSEGTMYAYDRGDSVSDVASAMEKRDKDYFREFINAKDDEKLEILDLVPKYMRRPLEAAWGLEVEEKDDLGAYFSNHALPDETWKGWDENIDLNNVKVKMAKNEQLEFSDTNIWADDVTRANKAGEIDVPLLNYKTRPVSSRAKLSKVLGKSGYKDVLYSSRLNGVTEDVNLYLKFNKKDKYAKEIEGKLASNI